MNVRRLATELSVMALLSLLAFATAGVFWETRNSAGTSHSFAAYDADSTFLIGGPRAFVPAGRPHFSFVSNQKSGLLVDSLIIVSDDIRNGRDTVMVPMGKVYEGTFPRGVDTLKIHKNLNLGQDYLLEVSN